MSIHKLLKVKEFIVDVSAGAYTSGDVVGLPVEITFASDTDGGASLLKNLTMVDMTGQDANLNLLFFNDEPLSVAIDKDPFVLSAGNAAKLIGVVAIPAAGYVGVGTPSIISLDLDFVLQAKAKSKSLWAVLVTAGTPTYTSDLIFKLGLEQA